MSFAELGLEPRLLTAIESKGYTVPSPIQEKAIPAILAGSDVMAAAQTGTGKTAAFTLPLLQQLAKGQRAQANQVRALVLTPTRELAAQVAESVSTYGADLPLTSTVVFGGVKINPQMMRLRRGADVLVATPGRLLDLYQQKAVKFNQLEVLILDEADRMLDMGFIHDLKRIMSFLPKDRQNLMFSATFADQIRGLAKGLMNNPVEISASPANTTAPTVKQWMCPVDKKQKPALLQELIVTNQWSQVLVFCRTKHGCNKLAKWLVGGGISADAIHGNKSQGARTRALAQFKAGEVKVLVATDIAARGLDIDQLPQVVNYDLPNIAEDYVHRIGRTGRANQTGQAVSLVCADEIEFLESIEHLTQAHIQREYIDGFIPTHEVPPSRDLRALKNKKPKKPKLRNQEPSAQAPRQRKPQVKSALSKSNQRNAPKSSARDAQPAKQNPWHKGPSKRPAR
ncbi:MAG TPA: ATP-dependent RNA helicase [Oceanospirillaceae bacterium]|nr:ATP-dependent RNA helicase [Oceanospirillaceae bacterium]